METTFITIHDLSEEARILYTSDSIVDILGHTPDEVVDKSTWDFFHPDEVKKAMRFHEKGLKLDKAAVLVYCQIRNRQGHFVTCECTFSICYDVMVGCTSIYRYGHGSQKRAIEAPMVRRMFASSPQDPRYHMLSHLSKKFEQSPKEYSHEPRAALFLNRFTRTLAVMYATSGIEKITGVAAEDMQGKSFYYCIAENCLEDAIKCLETAKGNDSIAYLRFWFRDPRQDDHYRPANDHYTSGEDTDMTDMTDGMTSEDESEASLSGGGRNGATYDSSRSRSRESPGRGKLASRLLPDTAQSTSRSGSEHQTREASVGSLTSHSSSEQPDATDRAIELEAVVSCTSDGLVVCLRRARQQIPQALDSPLQAAHPTTIGPGLFAAPWAENPLMPATYSQQDLYGASSPYRAPAPNFSMANPYAPSPTSPQTSHHHPTSRSPNVSPTGPPRGDFMRAISEVGVFAWALAGINGDLLRYSRGEAQGESKPPEGSYHWEQGGAGPDDRIRASRQVSASLLPTTMVTTPTATKFAAGNDMSGAGGYGDAGMNAHHQYHNHHGHHHHQGRGLTAATNGYDGGGGSGRPWLT